MQCQSQFPIINDEVMFVYLQCFDNANTMYNVKQKTINNPNKINLLKLQNINKNTEE